MNIQNPINLMGWINQNRDKLKPPVGNQVLFQDSEYIVMLVGGPNERSDFHINQTEELFYQIEGDIKVRIHKGNRFEDIDIKEGELFLLPAKVPHSPIRPKQTIGLVIEKKRQSHERDGFCWYCEKCQHLLYSEFVYIDDIVKQLPAIFDHFYEHVERRTCRACGHINPGKNT